MTRSSLITLFILLFWGAADCIYAENSEIVKGYEINALSIFCKSRSYLSCLGVTKTACESAIKTGNSDCISEKLINAINGNFDDENESSSIIRTESKLYSVCLAQEFRESLSISETKYDECAYHLKPLFDEYREKAKRKHEQLQKKID